MTTIRTAAIAITLASLAALPGCSGFHHTSTAPAATAAAAGTGQELSPEMVQRVQTMLQQQGLYNGSIDGKWGSGTQAAVRAYQQKHNLTASGQLDQATLNAMDLNKVNPNGSAANATPGTNSSNNAAPNPPSSTTNAATDMPTNGSATPPADGSSPGGTAAGNTNATTTPPE
jgi:peptidoglycan hydrolase-like protein with peptidoglycan-binding domain